MEIVCPLVKICIDEICASFLVTIPCFVESVKCISYLNWWPKLSLLNFEYLIYDFSVRLTS